MTTLTLDILARDRASKTLKDVGKASDQTSKKMSSGFMGIGKFAGVAAAGVGALGAAGVIMGIKTAASLEQAQIGFTTLLGSATKAGAYVKDLQKFAANTPFEFQGLVDSSRLLLGVGVASQKVIPMLTDFGDAAGALGIQQDAFQRIMLASSQAISAGRFQVGDLNQIVQNGIPAWSLLSKSLGKPVPELRKLASAGKLTADIVLPALQKQMHKDYGGSMAKQSQTLAGLWSTFTDTISQGLAQALLPLVPVLKSALPGAMNVMGVALQGLAKGLAFVVTGVRGIVAGFRAGHGAAGQMSGALSGLVGWVKGSLAPALTQLGRQVLPAVQSLFKTVAKAVNDNREAFRFLGAVLTGVVLPVLGFLTKVAIRSIILQITVVSTVIKAVVVPAVKILASVFLAVFGVIINGAAKAFGWIKGIGGPLKRAAAEFNVFRDKVNASLNGIHKQIFIQAHVAIKYSTKGINLTAPSSVGRNASGTSNWRGGPTWLHEQGPEVVDLPSGSRVYPASKSAKMMATGGGNQYITVNLTAPGDDLSQARRLVALLQKLQQSSGKPLQIRTA